MHFEIACFEYALHAFVLVESDVHYTLVVVMALTTSSLPALRLASRALVYHLAVNELGDDAVAPVTPPVNLLLVCLGYVNPGFNLKFT